jgi:hypothetical protein
VLGGINRKTLSPKRLPDARFPELTCPNIGSIVPNANAYITVAELKAYWADRNAAIFNPDFETQAAIIIATQYVDLNFDWRGELSNDDQSLDWPRRGVIDDQGRAYDSDDMPKHLKNAVAEYAKRQLDSSLQPDVSVDGTGNLLSISQTVFGAVQEVKTFEAGTGGYYGIKRYPLADNYLKGLTIGGVGGSFAKLRRC